LFSGAKNVTVKDLRMTDDFAMQPGALVYSTGTGLVLNNVELNGSQPDYGTLDVAVGGDATLQKSKLMTTSGTAGLWVAAAAPPTVEDSFVRGGPTGPAVLLLGSNGATGRLTVRRSEVRQTGTTPEAIRLFDNQPNSTLQATLDSSIVDGGTALA